MTGKEAWSIIAPLLASHSTGEFNVLDEAYVLVYGALQYWDEHKGDSNDTI